MACLFYLPPACATPAWPRPGFQGGSHLQLQEPLVDTGEARRAWAAAGGGLWALPVHTGDTLHMCEGPGSRPPPRLLAQLGPGLLGEYGIVEFWVQGEGQGTPSLRTWLWGTLAGVCMQQKWGMVACEAQRGGWVEVGQGGPGERLQGSLGQGLDTVLGPRWNPAVTELCLGPVTPCWDVRRREVACVGALREGPQRQTLLDTQTNTSRVTFLGGHTAPSRAGPCPWACPPGTS